MWDDEDNNPYGSFERRDSDLRPSSPGASEYALSFSLLFPHQAQKVTRQANRYARPQQPSTGPQRRRRATSRRASSRRTT
ncbi:MAG: hypothetical protein INR71_08345 [Terriglobus roseus]|nr:hypothetical protein [Terriglobus roseus]